MSLDHYVSVFSAAVTFAGLLLVAVQMHRATRQREMDSLVKLYDVNRELLSLGFSQPELFKILNDAPDADPELQRRYLQMWLNHLSLLHFFLNRSVFRRELKDSETKALAEFLMHNNMRQHWLENRDIYPKSFQKRVDKLLQKGEPPLALAARHASDAQHLAGDLLERGAGHPHEGLATRRGQDGVLGGSRKEALHEQVAVVGEDSGRTGTAITELGKLPVFPNNLLNSHNVIFRLIQLLKQNYANCFNPGWGGAFV
jgi:hypothetical protein